MTGVEKFCPATYVYTHNNQSSLGLEDALGGVISVIKSICIWMILFDQKIAHSPLYSYCASDCNEHITM